MAEKPQDQDFIVTEAIGKTEHFIDQNKKSLGIIIAALIVAVGGYLFYQRVYVAGKETDAQKELFRAEEYFKNDSLKLAINGDGNHPGLEEIVNEYSVSPSGNLARYYLGMAYMKQKEYDKAIDMLKSYDVKDEVTGSIVLGAIGDAYMELKNTEEAATYYEKASKENPNTFTTPIMLMKWASALESKGNYKGAIDVYEHLKKDYPSSPEGAQIDKYIARANSLAGN
ncbi:MAG: tetratricopeptide repeat protein [Bacteroidetes bacterium]|nr:tetratricopeptide repeat protein [Bacteroidota bacterium]MBL0063831.1 tetratricopeptide repeat protein [Bacteroidota bacterium]MBL0139756.1 tetratricopeptide repeat protein [Bacteroidota bacterium]